MISEGAPVSDTYTEKLNEWGLLLSVLVYGAHIALFCRCLRSFFKRGKRQYLLVAYTIFLFALASAAIALQIWWTQVAFIDNRLYPGGPKQFLLDNALSAPTRALTAMYVVMNWLADGLILYRFYVLCACLVTRNVPIALLFVVPCFLATFVTGVVFFPNIAELGLNLWTNTPSPAPGIAFMALSLGISTILTLLIIFRLLLLRRRLRSVLGPLHGQPYTSLVALLIESASLYTAIALMTIIACGLGSPMQYALLPMLGQLQAIPPVLITSRVAEGLALSRTTYSQLSSHLKFMPPSPSRSLFTTCASTIDTPITPVKPTLKLSFPRGGSWHSSSDDIQETPRNVSDSASVISTFEKAKLSEPHHCSDLCTDLCWRLQDIHLGTDISFAV
ncbi:hypothetical protein BDW22DRAFT_428740 [Trametopsis cervina]|nr:hypothetical protein BDW22DRAFT_428740 [Trametopsis cervina]